MVKFILIFFLLLISNSLYGLEISGTPKVIDGDTIYLNGNKIRFSGIDTPELKQRCIKDNVKSLQVVPILAPACSEIKKPAMFNKDFGRLLNYGRSEIILGPTGVSGQTQGYLYLHDSQSTRCIFGIFHSPKKTNKKNRLYYYGMLSRLKILQNTYF